MKKSHLKEIAKAVRDGLWERKLELMARELLNEDGVDAVVSRLATCEIDAAAEYLFSAVDVAFTRQVISRKRAREMYEILGIPPAKAERLHQECYADCKEAVAAKAREKKRRTVHRKVH